MSPNAIKMLRLIRLVTKGDKPLEMHKLCDGLAISHRDAESAVWELFHAGRVSFTKNSRKSEILVSMPT